MQDPASPAPRASVGQGAFWSIVNNGLTQFLSLAVFLVTARFVSIEAFGIMAVCYLVVEAFRQIAVESIGTAITARTRPLNEDYNAAFWMIAGIGVVGAGTIYFAAPLIASLFGKPSLTLALEWMALLLLTTGLSRTHESWLSVHMQFKALALRSFCAITVGGALGIFMAVQGYGLFSLIAQQLATALLGTIFLWVSTSWRPGFRMGRENFTAIAHDAKHLAMSNCANFINGQSDTYFSTYYLGITATGLYNAGKRIVFALNSILSQALGRVALPAFAHIREDGIRLHRNFIRIVAVTSALTAPLFAGVAALSEEMVILALGERWVEVAPVVSILCVAAYLTTLSQYAQSLYVVMGKARWQSLLAIAHAAINIFLYVVLARFGLAAIACAYSLRAVALFPVGVLLAGRLIPLRFSEYAGALWPSATAALLMFSGLVLAKSYLAFGALIEALILVPTGAVFYGLFLVLLDRKLVSDILGQVPFLRRFS